MKKFLFLSMAVLGMSMLSAQNQTIYNYTVDGLTGDKIDFSKFKGKKILIVNTASKCGFTPQYEDLEKISKEYKSQLVVVGFPSNDFGQQEPGTNEDIRAFCDATYGVGFPMAAKTEVVGKKQAPIFQYLTNKKLNGVKDTEIKWNFTKFLLDEKGRLLASFPSQVKPTDPEIIKYFK